MRNALACLPLLLLACGRDAPPAAAPSRPPVLAAKAAASDVGAKIDRIFAAYAKHDAPGCAVGVYRAGEVVLARGYGMANLEHGIAIDEDTVFDVGSISKQFTAAAVLLLVQDGKLSLDDDVHRQVPELPDYGHPVTLRQLLHHTSGVRDVYALMRLGGFLPDDPTDGADALFALRHDPKLDFAPGTAWRYSDAGYFLLALVVERASGMPFAAFARTRIFEPLGMTSTLVVDDHTRVVPRRATGYERRRDGAGYAIDVTSSEAVGATLLHTSVADLARWDASFYAPKLGGPEMLAAMRTPGKLADGTPTEYGMGLFETTDAGLAREEHSGSDAGYSGDVMRFPSERLTVACLCNDPDADGEALARAVAAVFLPQLGTAPPAPASAPAGTMPEGTIDAALGSYYDPVTLEARTVQRDASGLFLTLGLGAGAPRRPLEAVDARTFAVKEQPTRYVFDQTARTLTRVFPHADDQKYVRFVPPALGPSDLAEYTGRFASDLAHDFEVSLVDGALRLSVWGRARPATLVSPVARDELGGTGGLSYAVALRFERDARGHVAGARLTIDGAYETHLVRR